jgi:hypothetical protein
LATDPPRIFITDAGSLRVSAEPVSGQGHSLVEATQGVSSRNLVVMNRFVELCPGVKVTGNIEKADYLVRVRRPEPSPFTPFVKGNQIAIFNLDEDLIYSTSASYVKKAVRQACGELKRLSGQ